MSTPDALQNTGVRSEHAQKKFESSECGAEPTPDKSGVEKT